MKLNLSNKVIIITGVAGFIGSSLCKQLLYDYSDVEIIGIDNMNDYYDVNLKEHRLEGLRNDRFTFIKGDISNKNFVLSFFQNTPHKL